MPPLIAAAIIVFLEGLSFGVGLPVLPKFAEDLGGTVAAAGLLFALATAPRVLFAPMWGRLSDRLGRRHTLAIVALGTITASILWALSRPLGELAGTGLTWLLISRLLYGVFAAQSVLAMAVASDVSNPAKRAASMGVIGAAFGLAFTIGPFLGGQFAVAFGPDAIGWLSAAIQSVSLLVVLAVLSETYRRPITGQIIVPATSLLRLAAVPAIAWLLGICFMGTVAYSVLFPTFQPLAETWYGYDMATAGLALSIFGLVGAVVQGGFIRPTVRAIGEKQTAILGIALLAIGLGWVSLHPGELSFWAATMLVAAGTGLSVPAITALLSLSVGESNQGAIHGLNQSATSLGRAAGYLAGGALYTQISPSWAYLGAAMAALAGIVMLLMPLAGPTARRGADHPRGEDEAEDELPVVPTDPIPLTRR